MPSETAAREAFAAAEMLLGEAAHRLRIAREAEREAKNEYLAAREAYGAAKMALIAECTEDAPNV